LLINWHIQDGNVSLICHASRVLLRIILNRLHQYSERQLPEEQTGFRAGQGTRDALFIMQVMIEKLIDLENKVLYLIFIDYSKAFDRVDHGRLFDIMLDMGIPRHLVELVAGLYNNQESAVRWNATAGSMVPYRTGYKTGLQHLTDRVQPICRAYYRTVEDNYEGVVIGGRRITNLRYADDTTLLASTQEIRKFFKDLVQESACYNMYINAQKSNGGQYLSASGL